MAAVYASVIYIYSISPYSTGKFEQLRTSRLFVLMFVQSNVWVQFRIAVDKSRGHVSYAQYQYTHKASKTWRLAGLMTIRSLANFPDQPQVSTYIAASASTAFVIGRW